MAVVHWVTGAPALVLAGSILNAAAPCCGLMHSAYLRHDVTVGIGRDTAAPPREGSIGELRPRPVPVIRRTVDGCIYLP